MAGVKLRFEGWIDAAGRLIDGAGVGVIAIGVVLVMLLFLRRWLRRDDMGDSYKEYRRRLGRVILLGLEILVAGDIIRSVAVSPSFATVGVLAVIVLIRFFLSSTLEMEIEGRWPWQRPHGPMGGTRDE